MDQVLTDNSAAMTVSAPVERLRRGLTRRANSVLITILGDVIAPHRQFVWLGSLIGRRLCDAIYQDLLPASESFLHACVQTLDGTLADTPQVILRRLARP